MKKFAKFYKNYMYTIELLMASNLGLQFFLVSYSLSGTLKYAFVSSMNLRIDKTEFAFHNYHGYMFEFFIATTHNTIGMQICITKCQMYNYINNFMWE